jgi:ATP-dependent Lhr-like helicase
VLPEEVKGEFFRKGFAESNGMLVKGRLVTTCFERSEILSVVFSLQNLEERSRLKDMEEALDRYGGLRSNSEGLIRVKKFEPLQKLQKKGIVLRGHLVPDRVGFCTPESAALYRAARTRDLTPDEKLVMRIVRDQEPIKRERLCDLSPLGTEDTLSAWRSMYSSSRIYLDSTMSSVGSRRVKTSREKAWAMVFQQLFRVYGVITAENLSMMLGHEIPMRELRRTLRRLEDDGHLVKGYLLRGSGVLHWATKEAYEALGRTSFEAAVVLAPSDNLVAYLRASFRDMLPETGRYAIFRGITLIGSFEKRTKGNQKEFTDLRGEKACEQIMADYAQNVGIATTEKDDERVPDWEIVDFFHKSHPGMSLK